jgi:hypothetical protein
MHAAPQPQPQVRPVGELLHCHRQWCGAGRAVAGGRAAGGEREGFAAWGRRGERREQSESVGMGVGYVWAPRRGGGRGGEFQGDALLWMVGCAGCLVHVPMTLTVGPVSGHA